MTALVVIFAGTLLALTLFVVVKEREAKTGKIFRVTRVLVSASPRAEAHARRLHRTANERFDSFSKISGEMVRTLSLRARAHTRQIMIRQTGRLLNAMKGKPTMRRNGSSSLYLKQMVEHKRNGIDPNGRIGE